MVFPPANSDVSYEKMPTNEGSSIELIDGPPQVQEVPARIRHYFVFSLFSALCLCPATGLIALAYSLKSSAKADVKFHDKARLYSRRALLWNILSILFAVLSFILVIIFCYYLNELMDMSTRYTYYSPRRDYPTVDSDDVQKIIQSLSNN